MGRWLVRLTVCTLLVAAIPAGTAIGAKQVPTSLTSNDVSETYTTDNQGASYVTEIGGLLMTNRRCRKNRQVSITFINSQGQPATYGTDASDREGVFIIPHPTLDAPAGTDFSISVLERRVRRANCQATQVTVAS
jgi:hypothetical protein